MGVLDFGSMGADSAKGCGPPLRERNYIGRAAWVSLGPGTGFLDAQLGFFANGAKK